MPFLLIALLLRQLPLREFRWPVVLLLALLLILVLSLIGKAFS